MERTGVVTIKMANALETTLKLIEHRVRDKTYLTEEESSDNGSDSDDSDDSDESDDSFDEVSDWEDFSESSSDSEPENMPLFDTDYSSYSCSDTD